MTQITIDPGLFNTYRYQLSATYVPPGGTEADTVNLSVGIIELRVIKDYDKQIMPYYKLTVMVSQISFIKIRSTWKDGRIFLSVKKYVSPTGKEKAIENETTDAPYLQNAEMRIMMLDLSPTTPLADDDTSLGRTLPLIKFPMELAPVAAMELNKAVQPAVFQNATMNDVLVALTDRMSPPGKSAQYKFAIPASDNPTSYESILIPPLNFSQIIRHLDQIYGIFDGKLLVFFDSNRGYISSSTRPLIGPTGTPTSVILEVLSAAESGPNSASTGSYFDKSNGIARIRTAAKLGIDVSGPLQAETTGWSVNLLTSSFDTHLETKEQDWGLDNLPAAMGATTVQVKKEKTVWQAYANPLAAKKMHVATRENYAPLTAQVASFDTSVLEPSVIWRVITANPSSLDMEGNWRLQATEVIFSRPPGGPSLANIDGLLRLVPGAHGVLPSTDLATSSTTTDSTAPDWQIIPAAVIPN